MTNKLTIPLSTVLDREQGTLRIGHALRQLGQQNKGVTAELVDVLETVQSREQLLVVVAQIAQACAIASAKSPFAIIPTDVDLKYLLIDVDQYSVQTIARMLVVLSALRYPTTTKTRTNKARRVKRYPITNISTTTSRKRKLL